jgi:hypothetical protein
VLVAVLALPNVVAVEIVGLRDTFAEACRLSGVTDLHQVRVVAENAEPMRTFLHSPGLGEAAARRYRFRSESSIGERLQRLARPASRIPEGSSRHSSAISRSFLAPAGGPSARAHRRHQSAGDRGRSWPFLSNIWLNLEARIDCGETARAQSFTGSRPPGGPSTIRQSRMLNSGGAGG